ncbi:hypothetical protein BJX61DRAFT_132907 [Aspergillus egyptiacus]|nr:hypothetical protein BJX61DRAFT_132907 [Aspergillus egyptiacus]
MRVIDPQSAVLTNIEVFAHLSANPPRRPPNPPPGVNQRLWIPSPDLRDHNTVVKEIHNYVARLSPHLLRYPDYNPPASTKKNKTKTKKAAAEPEPESGATPTPTPLDNALRELITRLQPYGLTKGEVLMIVNLGVGLPPGTAGGGVTDENTGGNGEEMDVDQGEGEGEGAGAGAGEGAGVGEEGVNGHGEGAVEGQEGEVEEEETGDYGALALIDTVIEEREQRLSDENVAEILAIVRETLGRGT